MPRFRHWSRRAAAGVVTAALALSLSAAMTPWSTSVAGAATAAPAFYLDLGASVSVGVQPTVADPRGRPTLHGYANDLVAMESAKGVNLALTELGCPGESVNTFINGGDRCYKGSDTQLLDALAFLRAHYDHTGLVTIDLGFNTITPCFDGLAFDATCLAQKFATLPAQLSQVVASLKAAAGPNVTFIGVGHYDPFYASALAGASGQAFASASVNVMHTLNDVLQGVYGSFNVPFARVAEAFSDHTHTVVPLAKGVTGNVAATCQLTWMCAPAPYGPNIHPTDAGYHVIASAIAALIPPAL